MAWCSGRTTIDWQTRVIISIQKNGDMSECTNYLGIILPILPGLIYAECLEKRCRIIIASKLDDTQCGLRYGRSTTDQIFALW